MSEWTPTTEVVRGAASSWTTGEGFDRWLAAHDEQVRSEERERCAQIVESNLGRVWIASETLPDIAAAIRAVSAEQEGHHE